MILTETATLLTATSGSFAYHIALAMTLALLFSLAQVYRVRSRSSLSNCWYMASGGLLVARLALMTVAGLAWLLLVDGNILLPPIDRFVSMAGIAIFAWALLATQHNRNHHFALLIILVMGLLGMIGTFIILQESSASYPFNSTLTDAAWSFAGLFTTFFIIVILVIRRPSQWNLGLGGFSLLAAGYTLHMTLGPTDGSVAGFVRWAELGAYPLFAIAAARILIFEAYLPPVLPVAASTHTPVEGSTRIKILTEIAALTSAEQPSELAAAIVKSLAICMRAELCLLLTAPDLTGQFAVATAYDLIRECHLHGIALDSKNCPVITTALTRHRTLKLPASSRSPDLRILQAKLNLDTTGPSLLVPLIAEDEVQGGVMLLSPYTRKSWLAEDQEALELVASHLAQRFCQVNRTAKLGAAHAAIKDEASMELHRRIEAINHKIAYLTVQLQTSPNGEGLTPADNLSALLETRGEAFITIQTLADEIEWLNTAIIGGAITTSPDEEKQMTDEHNMAMRELIELRARLAALEGRQSGAEPGGRDAAPDIKAITSIAQDLRKPVSSILEYTDFLLGESVGTLGTTQRNFVERVREAVIKMEALLNNLLQITTIEASPLSLKPKPIDLLRCIEDAVTDASTTLREKRLALRMDFPDQIPPIKGDKEAITQIVVNLLSNAIGASPEGEEIIIATRIQEAEEADFLLLTFSDAGEGIPVGDLGRVFQSLEQADYEPIQGLGESGMGLSIVQTICEKLGGRVWFDSEVGVGSTFTVLLPVTDRPNMETAETKGEL